ncbi:MAG: SGNH/GDSL hydrolase family protein [Pseudomonadota bacterium]
MSKLNRFGRVSPKMSGAQSAGLVGAARAYGRISGAERLLGLSQGSLANANSTVVGQIPALGPYWGLCCYFVNYNNAPYTITKAATAAAPTHQHVGFGLDWRPITVGGVETDIVIAAGVGEAEDTVPEIVASDIIWCPSVERTDDLTKKRLQQFRTYAAGTQWALGLTSGFIAALNADPASAGRQFASRLPAGDRVTTIQDNTTSQPLESGGWFSPWHVEFFYENSVQSIAFCGDSLTQGQGSSTAGVSHGQLGFPQRACDAVPHTTCLNMGVGGQHHAASMATARTVIDVFRPDRIVLFAWSPNDSAASDEIMIACRLDVLQTLEYARRAGVARTLCTSGPVSSYSVGDDARIKSQNNWSRKVCASGLADLADIAPLLEDPSDPANIRPDLAADGTHNNSPGYQLISPVVAATF